MAEPFPLRALGKAPAPTSNSISTAAAQFTIPFPIFGVISSGGNCASQIWIALARFEVGNALLANEP